MAPFHAISSFSCLLLAAMEGVNSQDSHLRKRRQSGHLVDTSHRQIVETRIVGGQQAKLGSYPSYVQWDNGCSGVLIHDDMVLTAAHCNSVENAISRYPLYVGGNGRSRQGTQVHAKEAFPHPLYDSEASFLYDFLLLKLPDPVERVPFAPLNTNQSYPTDGMNLTVAGHGLLDEDDKREDSPNIYHEVQVPYIENCKKYYPQVHPKAQFCAGDMPKGGKDACQGDSGTGMYDDDGLLVGLVSWGIGCARPRRPGVYSRVSAVERWIAHKICQESERPPADCADLRISIKVDVDTIERIGVTLLDYDSDLETEVVVLPPGSLAVRPSQTLRFTFKVPKGRDYLLRVEDTSLGGWSGEVGAQDGETRYEITGSFRGRFESILLPAVGGAESLSRTTSPP